MLNSSSKFKSLGKREDFTFKRFESFVAAELFQEKSQTIKPASVNENKRLKSFSHPHENNAVSSLVFAFCFADAYLHFENVQKRCNFHRKVKLLNIFSTPCFLMQFLSPLLFRKNLKVRTARPALRKVKCSKTNSCYSNKDDRI